MQFDSCCMCTAGHGSLKGLRVKVFRPDSKPQWLHGIISYHDRNSRTMTVLSDQVSGLRTVFLCLIKQLQNLYDDVCYM